MRRLTKEAATANRQTLVGLGLFRAIGVAEAKN
jgi:hypothetical protein